MALYYHHHYIIIHDLGHDYIDRWLQSKFCCPFARYIWCGGYGISNTGDFDIETVL